MITEPTNPLDNAWSRGALCERDQRKIFVESGISEEVARARGYVTRTPETDGEMYREQGWLNLAKALPGLEVPIWAPGGKACFAQLRPHEPSPDFRTGKIRKYLMGAGERMRLDSNPITPIEKLRGTDPLFVVEGAMKEDALLSRGALAVAILGVWNWRGKNAQGGTAALPDFDSINFRDRDVYVCFDSDLGSNSKVHDACVRLASWLVSQGARVSVIPLPEGTDADGKATKVGVDDYLRDGGTIANLHRLAVSFETWAEIAKKETAHARLMTAMNADLAILDDPTGALIRGLGNVRDFQQVTLTQARALFAPLTRILGGKDPVKHWLESSDRRAFAKVIYEPAPSDWERRHCFNLFGGFAIEAKPGDCKIILDHIREVLCAGRPEYYDYLLNWCAHLVQKPGELPRVALLFHGDQGVGKGAFITDVLGALLGGGASPSFLAVHDIDRLLGRFNGQLAHAQLVFCDEATWGGSKSTEGRLKALITEPTLTLESKFQNPVTIHNCKRFIFASNEDWILPVGRKDRRFVLFEVSDVRRSDVGYFRRYYAALKTGALEAFMHHLQKLDISGWHPTASRPVGSTWSQMEQGLSSDLLCWIQCGREGMIPTTVDIGDTGPPQRTRFGDAATWPTENKWPGKRHVYTAYADWHKANGFRGQPVSESQFWKNGRAHLDLRFTYPRSGSGPRTRVVQFPPLQEFRDKVTDWLGQPESVWRDTDTDTEASADEPKRVS